jgi:VWFA-related protein
VFLKVHKALLGLIVLVAFSPTTAYADDEIRIDFPAGGQLKVRNDFGDVTAEVWSNNHVAVSAVIGGDGSTQLTRSPIIIDNRGSVITISVVRRPVDPAVPIHLKIKVPENADITARSMRGAITSSLSGAPATVNQPFQTRVGNGGRKIDIQTQAGAIVLGYTSSPEVVTATTDAPSKEPELLGTNGPKRAAGTPAEPVTSDDVSEGDVIRVDSQLVTLNISVIDRGTNRGLLGLSQSDFKLFEDGQEQNIVQFESSSAPFDMVLLIDLSGSTREVVKLIRAAAIRFVEAARPADRIGVITFAGEAKVISQLTADRELLRQRIETIDTARGDTKLYDATNFAMDELLKESKKSRRCAIVLMSDGLDGTIPGVSGQQGSRSTYPETLRNIQEFDGVLYTLWLNTEYQAMSPLDTQPEAFDAGHDRMKEMADAGGGVFYEVERLTDLAGAYEQVVADLGTMYSLAYRPSNSTRDGKWRAIRIGVGRTNAVPRGKRGYYAN